MKTYSLLLSFVVAVLSVVSAAHADEFTRPEAWTIESLVGKAPAYAGPSCYTAAMLAKGYGETVTYVGDLELLYFLKNFCEPRKGSLQAGDLITLTLPKAHNSILDPHIDHIATYVGDGKIFEKEDGNGLFKPLSQKNPHFQLKSMSESVWFGKRAADEGYEATSYFCKSTSYVRQQLATCKARAEDLGVGIIRRDFEKTMFMSPPKFILSADALEATRKFTESMRTLSKEDPCFDYLLAVGDSVIYGFKSIRLELLAKLPNASEWDKAKLDLFDVFWQRFQR